MKSRMRGGSRLRKILNWTKNAVKSGAKMAGNFGLAVAKDPRVQQLVLNAVVKRMNGAGRRRIVHKKKKKR
jgi:hypothetical protein